MSKINLVRFFRAFANSPHHIAAVNMLQDSLDADLLDKNADWVVCFEVDGEVQPLVEECHKGYIMKEPWQYT